MFDLSVIVPVYNMAKDGLLEYCIQSLAGQTLQNLEIIAVDEASTDDSLQVLKELEKRYPGRVKAVASPENKKQGGARNLGLQHAKGRYIGFMDADDWVVPDLYEKMVELADRTGADIVGTDMSRVYEHTMVPAQREACNFPDQTGILDHEKRKAFLLHFGPLGTKIYAREIFFAKEFQFPEHMSYEDNATFVELAMRAKHFEHIPEANVFYYQHGNSTTHSVDLQKCLDRMEAMRIMLKYARENGAWEEFPQVIEFHFSNLFYRITLFSYMQGGIRPDPRFLTALKKEMAAEFPNFRQNVYYRQYVTDYEQKLINLHFQSTAAFLLIYRLKQISKKIKSRKTGQ